jgi:hypothetical protein
MVWDDKGKKIVYIWSTWNHRLSKAPCKLLVTKESGPTLWFVLSHAPSLAFTLGRVVN